MDQNHSLLNSNIARQPFSPAEKVRKLAHKIKNQIYLSIISNNTTYITMIEYNGLLRHINMCTMRRVMFFFS